MIWKYKNDKIFNNSTKEIDYMIEEKRLRCYLDNEVCVD